MSSHPYCILPPDGDNIRLLRLLPNDDEAATVQCELCSYSLQKLGPRTHLYEALSYVWGDTSETLPIWVDNNQFPVTVNLHAALLRLRDHSFERIIWIDAICINQKNPQEQGHQVQLMAKIYSNAYRVIVWLGEEVVEIKGALEDIRLAANKELLGNSEKEINKQAILNLLQRPWFRRIWVLQEVAAARYVVIMCGSTEIDGYAFCLGVKSLQLTYMASPELQTLPSVTYLIAYASLRSKYTADSPETFSLGIRSLAELIDMFHTRHASDPRDKVYALLGMSLDDPSKATLQPDYTISWEQLFEKLVKYVLGRDTLVETSSQRPMIKSKGCILGQVYSIGSDNGQNVNITFKSQNEAWRFGDKIEWTLRASAKSIQERDIVCLLQGASKPTIIRLHKDFFAIIIIAVTPLKESGSSSLLTLPKLITCFPRHFPLVWDWEQLLDESQDQEESNNWTSFDQATRSWNVALILEDLEEYEKAEWRTREAIKVYERAFKGKQSILKIQRGLTPLLWAAGNGCDMLVELLLIEDGIDPDLNDNWGNTPLLWATENRHEAVTKLLLATGQVEINSKDQYKQTPLLWATKNGHEAIVKLLLATGQVEINSKDQHEQTPLLWATKNGHEAIVKLLLATGQVEINSKDQHEQTP
ncbi:heterokaryon incompatibility protein-domain-containing protein, partial [Hyaloscypha finlandica]